MEHLILEVGSGENPEISAREGDTLDIREDLPHIDFPGVDIAVDEWPVDSGVYDYVILSNVIEHIPGDQLCHVFREMDRVLRPEGEAKIETPHAGTYGAATDPTHMGTGGTTADFAEYFGGRLENYWGDLGWEVKSWAKIEAPVFAPPRFQFRRQVYSGLLSMQLVKLPFVTGMVEIRITKTT